MGAKEALKMLLNADVANVERRILKLTDRLIEAVKDLGLKLQTPEDPECRSGIVNFKIDRPQEVTKKLQDKGIIVSARSNGIRVSPHFYNTETEIDTLTQEIKSYL
jgi:selenocysteine lyase/cysteine desulfurase